MGNLSDRIGRRRVLVASLLIFGLLIGASGLATGLWGLVAVRVIMGFADGAFTPASISATIEASPPQRHGRNIGIQQMTLTLFGLGFAPLAVTGLLHFINWRFVFSIFALPGFMIAWLMWKVIPGTPTHRVQSESSSFADWKADLSYSNIRVLTVLMLCWLTCLVTTSAFIPNFLLDHLHVSYGAMGTVTSGIGFGAAAGTLTLPWLSDRIGRKPVMMLSTIGTCLMLLVLNNIGPNVPLLFASLFMVHFFNNALITLTVGPLCSETVPPALMATASGVVIAVGEMFGGGFATMIAGQVAEHLGIARILWLPIAALALGFLLCLRLRETLPALTQPATETKS
jgi:predicted MFS family arabinose efflux permease